MKKLRELGYFLKLMEEMKSEGLDPIVLKGPALSEKIYGDPFYRTFNDFDLLFHPKDLSKAIQFFNDRGFKGTKFNWPSSPKKQKAVTDLINQYFIYHPEHQVNFGLRYSTSWGAIHSENSYRVRSEESAELIEGDVPSRYFISNLNLQGTPGWSPATLYVQVMNLTDTQYQEILGAPMPGRWVMGGLKLDF